MISEKELKDIKENLENSQNPLFFFDNDVDGLCSFLLLQRAIGRGKGVAIKSFPELNESYLRKVEELNPDFVFILDKPMVSEKFIDGLNEKSIPIIWIDHHEIKINEELKKKALYINSFPKAEPVTYLCYNAFKRKEDIWIAMMGCISDIFKPDFSEKFSEENPEIYNNKLSAFDSLYTSELGKAINILNFGLKDTTTNVVKMIKFLSKAKNIQDILKENKSNEQMHKRYEELKKVYKKLIDKANSQKNENPKLLFFSYGGDMSLSAEISNELIFKNKNKLVVVAFNKSDKVNISVRGKNAKSITLKAISSIPGATGGGHEEACGAMVPPDKLEEFRKNIESLV